MRAVLRTVLGQGGTCPLLRRQGMGCRRCFCACGGPCDHAETVCLATWRCLRFSSFRSLRTFQLCNRDGYSVLHWVAENGGYGGDEGFFWRYWRIFRAPPVCPGVERQFLEPSTAKSSLPSRAPLHNSWDVVDIDIVPSWSFQKQQQQHSVAILAQVFESTDSTA